jgi:hypothetical protein
VKGQSGNPFQGLTLAPEVVNAYFETEAVTLCAKLQNALMQKTDAPVLEVQNIAVNAVRALDGYWIAGAVVLLE